MNMTEIKTPSEIGAIVAEKAKKTMMFIDIAALITEGIEADRAQLDNWEAELLFIDDSYLDQFIDAPRPEFDNNPNPILVAYRKYGPQHFGDTRGWLKYAMHGTLCDGVPVTPDHFEHARKVLTRIVALEDSRAE